MFITGGIGSSGFWERFTVDYDLPTDSAYSETCASIGLALFGLRMARITRDASYIDVVERALYNTVRAGISMEGNRYFYVNPLEVWPAICVDHSSRAHVKPTRQKWFDVACCPTNVARTFTSLGQYIYSIGSGELYLNLFIQNDSSFEMRGKTVSLSLKTDYPRTGAMRLELRADHVPFVLFIRVPGFAKDFKACLNGTPVVLEIVNGYCRIDRPWNRDTLEISFSIAPQFAYANPLVRANCGKIAILRGPEVYCFEEAENGDNLAALYLDPSEKLRELWREDLLGGVTVIRCGGKKLVSPEITESYSDTPPRLEPVELQALPYGSWGNRKEGEMIVWVHAAIPASPNTP
jgi:DUF1680 family protein